MTMLTCESQFEKKGNPWLTERERAEMQAQLTPVRGGRKFAKPRAEHRDPKPAPSPRPTSVSAENLKRIRQIMGTQPRYVVPLHEPKPLAVRVIAPEAEMDPWSHEAIAARAASLAAATERAKREVQERRDAQVEKIMLDYQQVMDGAFC